MKKFLLVVAACLCLYYLFGRDEKTEEPPVYDAPSYDYTVPASAYNSYSYTPAVSFEDTRVDMECSICHGTGRKTCSGCGGTGEMYKTNYAPSYGFGSGGQSYQTSFQCVQCDGTGDNPCLYCGGTGRLS